MFKGAFTALITPFTSTGTIDEKAFCHLIDWQIGQSIHGLVPAGTTGESATLSHKEHQKLIEICVKQVNGAVPVIAGAGSNSTYEAVILSQHAEQAGADAVLIVTPYYNKPNQQGLYEHFAAIASAVSLPIVIYNIPSRSIIDLLPETMGRLARDFKNIIAVKDATGRVERATEQRLSCGKDFIQFSGEDLTAPGFLAHGGHGCISVTSNVAPLLCARLQDACLKGDYETAFSLHIDLVPLHKALFIEPNPAGIKYAASKLGLCEPYLRLPMVNIDASTAKQIDYALQITGLLKA